MAKLKQIKSKTDGCGANFAVRDSCGGQGKFVLKIIVGWADSYIVCPRGLVTAWAQKRAHPTFIDFKHNYLKNKFAVLRGAVMIVFQTHFRIVADYATYPVLPMDLLGVYVLLPE